MLLAILVNERGVKLSCQIHWQSITLTVKALVTAVITIAGLVVILNNTSQVNQVLAWFGW